MLAVNKVRYDKEATGSKFEHPYNPWLDDHNDKEGRHYRGYKASQNTLEWVVYAILMIWCFAIYNPSLPVVGPYAGAFLVAASFAYSWFNYKYVLGYMESKDGRMPPFRKRTMIFRMIAFGAIGGIGWCAMPSDETWDETLQGLRKVDFVRGWLEASNPWRATLFDGNNDLEVRTLSIFALFITLHLTMMFLKKQKLLGDVLASRPTFVANNCHCCAVAPLAVYLLWTNYYKEGKTVEDYVLWQQFGIPITLAYFMGDIVWYCIPAKLSPLSTAPSWDFLILFHHFTMLACHYPTGSLPGATLCGAGDPLWIIELSCLGYLCEVSNPLMNYRWWLMQTLKKHRFDFSVTVVLLVASFVARVALLFCLIFVYILPKFGKFMAEKQVFIYIVCVAGHGIIMVLSMYWLKVLTKGGLSRMLVYVPPKKKTRGSFTFGADMGRSPAANKLKKK